MAKDDHLSKTPLVQARQQVNRIRNTLPRQGAFAREGAQCASCLGIGRSMRAIESDACPPPCLV